MWLEEGGGGRGRGKAGRGRGGPRVLPGEAPCDPHTRAPVSLCVTPPGFPGHTPPLLGNGSARIQMFCGSLRHACATSGRPEAAGRAMAGIQGLEGPQTLWSLSGLPWPSGRLGLSGRPGRPSFGAKKSRKPRGHGEERGVWQGLVPRVLLGGGPGPDPGDGSRPPPRLAACTGSRGWPPLGRVTAGAAARLGGAPWPPAPSGPAQRLSSPVPGSGLVCPKHQMQTSPAFLEPPVPSRYRTSWWVPKGGRIGHLCGVGGMQEGDIRLQRG